MDCRPSVFCICDEREWCTDYGTLNWVLVYFNSVIKRVKQCCCMLILHPKSTLPPPIVSLRMTIDSADDSKFWIGPSIRIESRIGRTIRNRIESRSFAGPYWSRPTQLLRVSHSNCVSCDDTLLISQDEIYCAVRQNGRLSGQQSLVENTYIFTVTDISGPPTNLLLEGGPLM